MSILIENVTKTFGSFHALKQINLEIQTGELVALLGPSGSGKTTLLRIIAGLEDPDEGIIHFGKKEITHLHTAKRKVGYVFQHYALFKHMTVFDNIAYGLKVLPKKTRPSKKEIESKVNKLLQLIKLEAFANRYPAQLSGGQKQRVALARALAVEPKLLLLDEPFGALDAKVRKELRRWLRQLHDDFQITSIFVTHDQEEALDVANRIVIMNEGKIEQIGSPDEVYEQPNSPFVYNFLGNVNVFKGRVQNGKLFNGDAELPVPDVTHSENDQALGYVRPHELSIVRNGSLKEAIKATIAHIHTVGRAVHIELKRKDTNQFLEVELTKEEYEDLKLRTGEEVFVKPKHLQIFKGN
ncbi:sulfate ABC transporter ATP-binding protein [Pueribacillus theae]|uniref:Sulfate ABC transporter ATP-binding protein n=1 Tax=Pueribacillus theae TaxID=2171751 RepID=A0A2U1K544_9BACI|nr:sulfate/molybdate ABC transporter ATP-binding protein [Pueribacillus theae]PWA12289.1 sulfate ABC transporter ATP-binding protein [Pueribacillus theae]